MFQTKKLADIYTSYLSEAETLFGAQRILEILDSGNKKYKVDILQMLDTAIAEKDASKLQFCIGAAYRDGLDKEYSDRFYKIILDTWHEEHEDIVDSVFTLKDERFSEPLYIIAMDRLTYRKFDDENESTLRKCIHGLKAIDTNISHGFLSKLIETGNPNVQYALEIYK